MLKAALTRLAKGSVIYGVGGILQRFMSLLLLPFFTRALTPTDYGAIALISLVSVALGGLFSLGTGSSRGILYFREQAVEKRPTIIWSNAALMAVNGLIFYAILFLLAPSLSQLILQTEEYSNLIRLSLLGLLLTNISSPFLAYLRMEELARRYVVLTLSNSLITIGLSIWFVLFLRLGITGVILAGALGQMLLLMVCLLAIGRTLAFKVDWSLFAPLVRIGFPSIFGLFAFMVIDYADRQMIERMISLDALGIYSVGYSFGMVIMIATGAFATAWPPFFMSYIHKKDEARAVFARTLTYYVLGFGVLVVAFFLAAKPVVLLLTAPNFHGAFIVVGLVAAGYMLKGCYLIVLPGIYFAEKLHLQTLIEWVAALVNIALNLWLIPIYGILGAALATFASYLTLPVLAWAVARRYLEVDYEWKRLAWIVMAVFTAACGIYWLSVAWNAALPLTILVHLAVGLTFIGIAYGTLLSTAERAMIRSMLKI